MENDLSQQRRRPYSLKLAGHAERWDHEMTMGIWIAIGFAVLILIGILQAIFVDQLPKRYLTRSCMGRDWRNRFPGASKQEIRKFLNLFLDAFAFRSEHRLKFGPDDKVIDVYRALCPRPGLTPDSLECETLVMSLEKQYGVEFPDDFGESEPTLGDVFEFVTKDPNKGFHGTR